MSLISNVPNDQDYVNFPDALKDEKRWLVYRMEWNEAKNKFDKPPFNPLTGRRANDPSTAVDWATAFQKSKEYSGVGFYVEEPYCVIDIDQCRDLTTGIVAPWAMEIVKALNSYWEVSPNGTGLHGWIRGKKPGNKCRKGIEIYDTGRYMTVTGLQLPGTADTVNECDITPIYERMLAGEFEQSETNVVKSPALPAAKLKAENGYGVVHQTGNFITTKKQLLMEGSITEGSRPFTVKDNNGAYVQYESHSEADAALVGCLARDCNGDAEKIDMEFRKSVLYREKWEREDYRSSTISYAVAHFRANQTAYGVQPPTALAPVTAPQVDVSAWRLAFKTVEELEAGEIRMLIGGFLPEGTTYIGGLPGEGKTLVALSMCKALTTGKNFLGSPLFPVSEIVPVIYLIPESGARAFRKRCERFGIPSDPNKFICRTCSEGKTLLLDDPLLLEAIRVLKPVVFLDTMIRFSQSSDENAAAQNRQMADAVIALRQGGAVAVIALHHATKDLRIKGMSQETVLRGSGDIAATADAVYGLLRDNVKYDCTNGPNEIDIMCVKPRDFTPPAPFRVAATHKSPTDSCAKSYIDETGDFHLVSIGEILRDKDARAVTLVREYPTISLDELVGQLGTSKYSIRKKLAQLGWTRSGGQNGSWGHLTLQTSGTATQDSPNIVDFDEPE